MPNFADAMEAIANAVADADIEGVGQRCYGWPMGEVPVPCFVVGYPDGEMDLNLVYDTNESMVRCNISAWWIVGGALSRTTPQRLAAAMVAIKTVIDGEHFFPLDHPDTPGAQVIDTCLVMSAAIQPVTVGAVEYLGVRFTIDTVVA